MSAAGHLRPPLHVEGALPELAGGGDEVFGEDGDSDGDVVAHLISAGLVDEYRLFVFPVLLGRGERLFADATEVPKLRLVEATPFRSGVVLRRYAVAGRRSDT